MDDVLESARCFHQRFDSVLIATATDDGLPAASYAPYMAYQGDFYVYVSDLAVHTQNLKQNPRASLMFIEDEGQSSHLFARKRMVYSCRAEMVCRDTQVFMEIMDRFVEKHGSFMEMMRGLLDFNLFRLLPCRASFVAGFAKAYELSGENLRLIRHRDGQGHVVNKREPG